MKPPVRGQITNPVALGGIFLFLLLCATNVLANPLSGPLGIEVQSGDQVRLNKQIFGSNIADAAGYPTIGSVDFEKLFAEVKPSILRFPEGEHANFYHFEIDDFHEDELSTASPKLTQRIRNVFKRRRIKKNSLSFDQFMGVCRKEGIEPVVIVNLFTGSPEESGRWVKYAKDKGYKIKYWELGNELYAEPYRNKFPDVASYIRQAKMHAAKMREADPSIQISVCATHYGFREGEWGSFGRFLLKWDEGLAKETFFDAYSVHWYVFLHKVLEERGQGLANFVFAQAQGRYVKSRAYYKRLYKNKPVWISEWNLLPMQNPAANTLIHALYCGLVMINMVNDSEWIELANYYVLSRVGYGFPLFSPKTQQEPSEVNHLVKRTNFISFEIFNWAFSNSNSIYSTRIASDIKQGLLVTCVGTEQKKYVFVLNLTSKLLSPQINVDGQPMTGDVDIQYLSNPDFEATNGGNTFIPQGNRERVMLKHYHGPLAEFNIPAHFLGAIEIQSR